MYSNTLHVLGYFKNSPCPSVCHIERLFPTGDSKYCIYIDIKIIFIYIQLYIWLYINTYKLIEGQRVDPLPPEEGLSDRRCTFDKNSLFSCRDNSCGLVLFSTCPIFIQKHAVFTYHMYVYYMYTVYVFTNITTYIYRYVKSC